MSNDAFTLAISLPVSSKVLGVTSTAAYTNYNTI